MAYFRAIVLSAEQQEIMSAFTADATSRDRYTLVRRAPHANRPPAAAPAPRASRRMTRGRPPPSQQALAACGVLFVCLGGRALVGVPGAPSSAPFVALLLELACAGVACALLKSSLDTVCQLRLAHSRKPTRAH